MQNKKLLITGGTHADIPLIEAAKKQGFYVITIGSRPNDIGHQYSDEYHQIDYCDEAAMCALIKEKNIQYICPSCNDFAFITTAKVAHQLNLPGNYDQIDAIYTLHHKDHYRQFATENNITCPKAMGFDNAQSALHEIQDWQFPLIVKPVDFCGGRGIAKIHNIDEAKQAIDFTLSHSRLKKCVIEEFVQGSNHGFSAILQDQKITFYFVDNEYYYKNPFRVSGASSSHIVPQQAIEKIIAESQKISQLLQLKDGIFHVQFILSNTGPVIIEITRRPPGDLYIKLVEYATNIDYSDYLVRFYTGQDVVDLTQVNNLPCILRHCIMSNKNGHIKNVTYDSSIKDKIIDQLILGQIGDNIDDMMTYKYGIAFLKFDENPGTDFLGSTMQELIKVEIE